MAAQIEAWVDIEDSPAWDDQTDLLEPFHIAVANGAYMWAGYRVACVADEAVADQPGAFAALLDSTYRAAGMADWECRVMVWFKRWLPTCMAQVPEDDLNAFMDGVKLAHRRGLLLLRRPAVPASHLEAVYEAIWKEVLPVMGTSCDEQTFWGGPPDKAVFGGEVA
jgi:hypothetical protein